MELLSHFITVFLGFFAIMNPVANTPVFLALVGEQDRDTQKAVARKTLVLAFAITCCFCLLGNTIFHLFGISLPAFRLAGGVLVALVGYQMLHGEPSSVQQPSRGDAQSARESSLSIAISPLAVPMLAGPGTIATAVNYAASGDLRETILVALAFGLLCLVTYGFFMLGNRLQALIGKNGINVITRLMGLILTVIGAQLIIEGVKGAMA